MKKKTVFRVVLIMLCVLCTLSVLQVWNVLANHRQNERDDSTDDSFNEDSHDLVLPNPPEFENNEPVDTMDEKTNDIEEFFPITEKPRTPGLLSDTHRHDLLYRYEPYYIYEGWNYTEMYTSEPNRRKHREKHHFLEEARQARNL